MEGALDSLSAFSASSRAVLGRRVLVPVDTAWINLVHQSTEHGEARFRVLAAQFLKSTQQPGPPSADLFSFVCSAVAGSSPASFMAPMCSPLTVATSAHLRDPTMDYLVNEKSDGLRVVLTSLLAPKFPRWTFSAAGSSALGLGLYDVCQLEEALHELEDSRTTISSQTRLSFGAHTLRRVDGGDSNSFCIELKTAASGEADEPPRVAALTRTVGPRHFTYVFDRSMQRQFLLMDEYVFAGLGAVVMDAELLLTIPAEGTPARALMGVFDLFSHAPFDPTVTTIGSIQKLQIILQRSTMRERHDAIERVALGPLQNAMPGYPFGVTLFRKHMWPIAKLGECLAMVRKDAKGRYVFGGTTYNDGIIFTPNNFDVVSGSREHQLKWKWPEKLSVDWLMIPKHPIKNNFFKLDLFFKKKRYGVGADQAGLTEYSRSAKCLNPRCLVVPEKGCVVECTFDIESGCWVLDRLREDKTEPNSAVTAVSVFESIAEKIDVDMLVRLAKVEAPDDLCADSDDDSYGKEEESNAAPVAPAVLPTDAAPRVANGGEEDAAVDVPECRMALKAVNEGGETRLKLQWHIKLPDVKNIISCNHRDVENCFGLGMPCPRDDPSSDLVPALHIALANAGGSYAWTDLLCSVFFDPSKGRWGIASVCDGSVNKFKSLLWQVLLHVEKTTLAQARALDNPVATAEAAKQQAMHDERCRNATTDTHYAERTKELSSRDNTRSALRRYNNWVKLLLIKSAVDMCKSSASNEKIAVLELCCGRGGDLKKWMNFPVRQLTMVDSCFEAVGEAAARYNITAGLSTKIIKNKPGFPGIPARFHVADCFSPALGEFIDSAAAETAAGGCFDIVSCQFSMHYAFGAEASVRGFLSNVSRQLRPGGLFIGTTVDDKKLLHWRSTHGDSFGNDTFRIAFDGESSSSSSGGQPQPYGVGYRVDLDVSVADALEYVVDWQNLVRLCAADYKLQLVTTSNFEEVRDTYAATAVGKEFMAVVTGDRRVTGAKRKRSNGNGGDDDDDGEEEGKSQHGADVVKELSKDEFETACLFRSFVFKKMH